VVAEIMQTAVRVIKNYFVRHPLRCVIPDKSALQRTRSRIEGLGKMRIAHPLAAMMLLMLLVGGLSACGKKAGHVYAPDGAEDNGYPHTYPDPNADPKPGAN
jgi:predicted small lipoprotein YifL